MIGNNNMFFTPEVRPHLRWYFLLKRPSIL
jgi:hypothetical protein